MIQVTKQAVQQWVMIDYLAQKHRFQANLSLFEQKYTQLFDDFEKRIQAATVEVFDK